MKLWIKNGTVYSMAGPVQENCDIVIVDGKIEKIGCGLPAEDADQIINAEGLNVFPGFIDAHTHVGGMNFSRQESIDDYNEMTKCVEPEAEALFGTDIFTNACDLEAARRTGITTICITPGSGNLVNGWAYAAKTYGDNIFDMVLKNPVALKIALGGNPKRTYASRNQAPATRMSMPYLVKNLFQRTEEYMKKKEAGEKVDYNSELEAVIPVIRKEIPLKIHCTQYDMLAAIDIAKSIQADFSLEHAWGAGMYLDELEESGCSICYGPIGSLKAPGECSVIDIESVVELDKRGITTALITDAPILSIDCLIQHVGEAVKCGLPIERALRMITCNPAKILGIEDRVGSLESGKDGNVVLAKGIPGYDVGASVMYTVLEGRVVYRKEDERPGN